MHWQWRNQQLVFVDVANRAGLAAERLRSVLPPSLSTMLFFPPSGDWCCHHPQHLQHLQHLHWEDCETFSISDTNLPSGSCEIKTSKFEGSSASRSPTKPKFYVQVSKLLVLVLCIVCVYILGLLGLFHTFSRTCSISSCPVTIRAFYSRKRTGLTWCFHIIVTKNIVDWTL